MWRIHSIIEPTLDSEQKTCGEPQLYWSPHRQQLDCYYIGSTSLAAIYHATFIDGRWKKLNRPGLDNSHNKFLFLGQGAAGVLSPAGRTGLIARFGKVFLTYCDMSGPSGDGGISATGRINIAEASEDGFDFAVVRNDILPALPGVEWTRLNLCNIKDEYGKVFGLAEAFQDGEWRVFAVEAPMHDGPYTVLNGGQCMESLRPPGMASTCSGSVVHRGTFFETFYHCGVAGGLTEIYHAVSRDGINWSQVDRIVSANDIPPVGDMMTLQLADVSYIQCPLGEFIAFDQVSDGWVRVIVMKREY